MWSREYSNTAKPKKEGWPEHKKMSVRVKMKESFSEFMKEGLAGNGEYLQQEEESQLWRHCSAWVIGNMMDFLGFGALMLCGSWGWKS